MGIDIRVGCSGFQKSHSVYYQHLKLVEIQQTFYKPPRLETAARWREEAPQDFVFTIKAYQVITHDAYIPTYRRSGLKILPKDRDRYGSFRDTEEVAHAWNITQTIASILNSPIILFQCPPQFTPTDEHISNLRHFFRKVDRGTFRFAWEPRGHWEDSLVTNLCQELDLIHAVDPFLRTAQSNGLRYYRMQGGPDYQHVYTGDELNRLFALCAQDQPVYCLFNNANMWDNCLGFLEIIKQHEI